MDQREELFTQLQKFADRHSLKYRISFYDANKKFFLVAIYGDGFHIAGSDVPNSPAEIDIDFFNEASTPTPQATVDELFSDLKSFISAIPNLTITHEK